MRAEPKQHDIEEDPLDSAHLATIGEPDTVAGLVGGEIIGFCCDLPSSKFGEGQNKRIPRVE